MVVNLEKIGTIGYKKLMINNSIRIMMNDIFTILFFGTNGQMLLYFQILFY
jgi:hypothetical protein